MANVILSGVGGQGVLTLAALIGNAAVIEGYEVRLSEVHGMAQRGGSVTCHVRYGAKIYSPLLMEGSADMIIALEVSEAFRVAQFLKVGGAVILNDYELPPPMTIIKGLKYPGLSTVIDGFSEYTDKVYVVNANKIAAEVGSLNVANTVILGAAWATGGLDIKKDSLIEAMTVRFGEKWKSINVKAFEEGAKAVKKQD
jgi:indolepyruvate ferredoxin oxidoreductase beta subunit